MGISSIHLVHTNSIHVWSMPGALWDNMFPSTVPLIQLLLGPQAPMVLIFRLVSSSGLRRGAPCGLIFPAWRADVAGSVGQEMLWVLGTEPGHSVSELLCSDSRAWATGSWDSDLLGAHGAGLEGRPVWVTVWWVCYRPPDEEEVYEAFFRQLGEDSVCRSSKRSSTNLRVQGGAKPSQLQGECEGIVRACQWLQWGCDGANQWQLGPSLLWPVVAVRSCAHMAWKAWSCCSCARHCRLGMALQSSLSLNLRQ